MQISDINFLPGSPGNKTGKHTKAWGLISTLWNNKVPIEHIPDITGFERVKCGVGPDKFSIYHNNEIAYIAWWRDGQQYWYTTSV